MIDLNVPWVLLRVRDQLFGVRATNIREMAEIPTVTAVPNLPEYVLGLITMRGQVVPTIDLRRRLGLPTADDDLRAITSRLEAAYTEHRQTLERMERPDAQAGRPASVECAQCALSVWLRAFHSRNPMVQAHLAKLEGPHAALHQEEARVAGLFRNNHPDAGEALRDLREKQFATFSQVLTLCGERLAHAHRQIVVVFMHEGRLLGAVVDEVESIERLKERSIEELSLRHQGLSSGLTRSVGRRTKDDEVVLLLEIEELFQGNGDIPAEGAWQTEEVAAEADSNDSVPAHVSSADPGGVTATPASNAPSEPVEESRASMAWCGAPRAGSACTFGR